MAQGFSPSHWPLCAADQFWNQHFVLFFVSCGARYKKPAALVGVHRLETVALFRFLFGDKKEGPNGRQLLPRKPSGKSTPPPLRGTSPYTGEAQGRRQPPPKAPLCKGSCRRKPTEGL